MLTTIGPLTYIFGGLIGGSNGGAFGCKKGGWHKGFGLVAFLLGFYIWVQKRSIGQGDFLMHSTPLSRLKIKDTTSIFTFTEKIHSKHTFKIYNHNRTSRSKICIFSTLNFVHPLLSITQTPL